MKLFLYCSYTHSKRGFVLTRLTGEELTAVSLAGSEDPGEQAVYRFFTFDDFRILWQLMPENDRLPVLPGVSGGLFGIRSLRTRIDDREGVVNVALIAEKEELDRLERIAAGIVSDPAGFALALGRCLSVGGVCGYQADGRRLQELLESCQNPALPAALREALGEETARSYTVRDLLRLAVYVSSWEQAAENLHPKWIWKICPRQAFSQEEFIRILGKRLWQ